VKHLGKNTLLSQAEPREKCIKNILDSGAARDAIESGTRDSKTLSDQNYVVVALCFFKRPSGFIQQGGVAPVQSDGPFARQYGARRSLDLPGKFTKPLPRDRRNAQQSAILDRFNQVGFCSDPNRPQMGSGG